MFEQTICDKRVSGNSRDLLVDFFSDAYTMVIQQQVTQLYGKRTPV